MSFLENIRQFFRREKSPAERNTNPRKGGTPLFLQPNTELSIASVYRCVNLLSDSVACLPVQYKRLKDTIFVDDPLSRLHYLLNIQPCEYLSAFDFWKLVVQYLLLNGNAYIVPVYDSGTLELGRLALADPTAVMHDTTNDTYTIHDVSAGISGTYRENEIIHLKNYTRDGKTGLSTIGFARMALDITGMGDRETLNRFSNGGNVRGVVSNDGGIRGFGEYQDKELEKTAMNLDDRFRSGERIVSLPGQVQFSPISLSSTDMQFLETRKFSVCEICRFFGVHPSFVFADIGSNYKDAEMSNIAFLSSTLNPILRKIENELLRKLVSPELSHRRKFQFDRRGLSACDLNSRVKYQADTIAAGIYTVNEWRAEENKPAVEGGDTVLVSANLKGISEVNKAAQNI